MFSAQLRDSNVFIYWNTNELSWVKDNIKDILYACKWFRWITTHGDNSTVQELWRVFCFVHAVLTYVTMDLNITIASSSRGWLERSQGWPGFCPRYNKKICLSKINLNKFKQKYTFCSECQIPKYWNIKKKKSQIIWQYFRIVVHVYHLN